MNIINLHPCFFLAVDTWTCECSVIGGVATVWQGSAFECLSSTNEIVLLHRHYDSFNGTDRSTSFSCNNGGVTIVAQIIGVSNNTYTSQITVSDGAKKSALIGKTVECVVDNGNSAEAVKSFTINTLLNDTSKNIFNS